MSNRYRNEWLQDQRRGRGGEAKPSRTITARDALSFLALFSTICAVPFWYQLFGSFTSNLLVSGLGAVGMAIAPPAMMAFIIPWSPGGMLMARILGKTWGQAFLTGSVLFLVYWAFELLNAWWGAQEGAATAGVAFQMTILFIILLIIIPALLWSPILAGDLKQMMYEEQMVREYEILVKGKLAMLRTTLMRAHSLTAKGFANLVVQEREELAGIAVALVNGIENIQRELGENVREMADWSEPFDTVLEDNNSVRENMYKIADELVRQPTRREERNETPALSDHDHADVRSYPDNDNDSAAPDNDQVERSEQVQRTRRIGGRSRA